MSAEGWTPVIREYMILAAKAENAYQEAKADFDAVTEAYRARARSEYPGHAYALLDAESKSKSDQRRITAMGKAEFMCQEAQMYAALAQMAMAAQRNTVSAAIT